MTREEALERVKGYLTDYLFSEDVDEIDEIMDALKQEPIIDKIRADIKGMTPTYHNSDWSIIDLVPISEVLKRIDKHKAESEDKG